LRVADLVPIPVEQRILLNTVTVRDATITGSLLERAGIRSYACRSVVELARELERGAGALLIAEETLTDPDIGGVVALLRRQPQWSDLPVLIIAGSGLVSNAVLEALDMPANITVIERPLRIVALISAVRSALRARSRQYELRAVLEGLREADRRKTEFIATLAHELRNPLAPLSTALAILTLKPHEPEQARPHYEMMRRQISHMVRLIDDLMEVSRITRGKIELKTETVPLERILREAAELSRPALQSGGHELHMAAPEAAFFVRGDAVRLTQVFSNLLNNAAKYTPRGGRIDVHVERAGERVHVRVCDNGVGIPPDMLAAIFEMFVQVSNTSRAGQGGLGIGLTLVKSLVELHGGTVRASSEGEGCGTEIVVDLPLAAIDERAAELPRGGVRADQLGEQIMIVDDNCDAADSLSALLTSYGARTLVAYSGVSALEMLAANEPSVAILDIGMPGLDGYELARCVRNDPRHSHILLIALTGWGQPEDRSRIAAAGFDHHFLKPLDPEALIKTICERRPAAVA
jgi:signal transduction histidine kinase/CheY-like chemotaxis protein